MIDKNAANELKAGSTRGQRGRINARSRRGQGRVNAQSKRGQPDHRINAVHKMNTYLYDHFLVNYQSVGVSLTKCAVNPLSMAYVVKLYPCYHRRR
jgi:hypothetical protein